jgi:hypothetical protein
VQKSRTEYFREYRLRNSTSKKPHYSTARCFRFSDIQRMSVGRLVVAYRQIALGQAIYSPIKAGKARLEITRSGQIGVSC